MDKKQSLGSSGFTLIEVLISTIILGMVLGIALMASSGFMDVWQKGDRLFSDAFTLVRYKILLSESIESTYEYYLTDKPGQNRQKDKYFPFFAGKSQSAEFVTLSSVFNHGAPAIAKLYVQKNDSGKYDLVYKEADLEKFFIKYAQDKIEYTRQIDIYQNLENIKFRYYGLVETKFDPELMKADRIFEWEDKFSGRQTMHVPKQMEITINSDETGQKKMLYTIKAENKYKNGLFNPPF